METRRDFLRLAGLAGAASACGCAAGGAGGDRREPWSAGEVRAIESLAPRQGGLAWAAWQGNREVVAANPGLGGPALSISKALAALAATRAAEEGWLDATETAADTIHEWRGDDRKSRITVGMLLQQVSGLEAGVIALYRNRPADKGRVAVSLRCVDSPGAVFRYGPGHWEALGEVMKRKLARQGGTLSGFMERAVTRPVGIYSGDWRSDGGDVPYLSTGAVLSVRGLGRLGKSISRLLLGDSVHGFDPARFAEMTRTSSSNPMFGGGLWRNGNAGRPGAVAIEVERSIDDPMPASFWRRACLSTRQSADLVALIGSGGRRVVVWPGAGKRFARLGRSTAWRDTAFFSALAAGRGR